MHSNINDFLHFNPKEKRGILVLIVLVVLLFLVKQNLYLFYSEPKWQKNKLDSLRAEFKVNSNKKSNENLIRTGPKIPPFSFDPNKLSKEAWIELGLTEKQAQTILNYLKNGGSFKKKTDLKKVYSISDSFYASIEDSLLLPLNDEGVAPSQQKGIVNENQALETKKKVFNQKTIFLNNSDTLDWESLYGIGPVYARRILKYRNSLGGFYSANQLYEVWGIQDSVIDKVMDYLKVDSIKVEKMNINKLKALELKSHPYIDWNIANAIVNYRNSHGNYNAITDIRKIHIISDSLFNKIKPYLSK